MTLVGEPGRAPPAGLRMAAAASRRELAVVAIMMVWVAAALLADYGADIWRQQAIGIGTWLLLLWLLRSEHRGVRAQVALVVMAATCVEYTFAPLLGFYTYRLGNVPAFVPPGHGIIYLAALAIGRSALADGLGPRLLAVPVIGGGAWALCGATLASRRDLVGAVLFFLLLQFLLVGRAPLVYAGAFLVTTYLELMGTVLGTWSWSTHDPTGLLPAGNPPSGISGAYCILDATALALGPRLLLLVARVVPLCPSSVAIRRSVFTRLARTWIALRSICCSPPSPTLEDWGYDATGCLAHSIHRLPAYTCRRRLRNRLHEWPIATAANTAARFTSLRRARYR
jgi:hypothetical protein